MTTSTPISTTPSKLDRVAATVANPPPQTQLDVILERLDTLGEQLEEINERLLNMSLGRYEEDD